MEFKHFLQFVQDNRTIEISEPFGFDGQALNIEQDAQRYGRDITYGSEDINFEFVKGIFELNGEPIILPDGTETEYNTMGFEYLLDYFRKYGFESEVNYILFKDDVQFSIGMLDFFTAETDYFQTFKCKIIQESKRAEYKRRMDLEIDAFSQEDINGNPIQPCTPVNILLKAKPVRQVSEWSTPANAQVTIGGTGGILTPRFGLTNQVMFSGIENTLSFIQGTGNRTNFAYIEARNTITNMTLKFSNINIQFNGSFTNTQGVIQGSLRYYIGESITNTTPLNQTVSVFAYEFDINNASQNLIIDEIVFNNLSMNQGERLWVWFENLVITSNQATFLTTRVNSMTIEATATATALDSVIQGVRVYDLMRHASDTIGGLQVIAPEWQPSGKHYNNFAFNGALIRQFSDRPFTNKLKDILAIPNEVNADYQINPDNIVIGQFEDFYQDIESGVFLMKPDETFNVKFNPRFGVNQVEYAYKTFEQDRDEKNTIDATHTQTQWIVKNKMVENNKKVEVDFIRDAFTIESARRQGVQEKPTTTLSIDNRLFILDCIQSSPLQTVTVSVQLTQQANGTTVKLANTTPDNNNPNFSWLLLGIVVGGQFIINSGGNVGTYTITEIERTVLTLQRVDGVPQTFTGIAITNITYRLSGVSFINRTGEGFELIEGVESPFNYSNLRYTPRRNLIEFERYLSTAQEYNRLNIDNTFYFNGGNLVTQLNGEGSPLAETDPLIYQNPILSPEIVELTVISNFAQTLQAVESIQNERGYFRCYNSQGQVFKGYPQKFAYEWISGELKMTLELKYEPISLIITKVGDDIFVNNQLTDVESFQINDIFVQLFDQLERPLFNPTRITDVTLNGIVYDDRVEFSDALLILLS
jgi:hypothetical protein